MDNENITVFIQYMILILAGLIPILVALSIVLAINSNKGQENYILIELKKMKKKYDIEKTYEYKKFRNIWYILFIVIVLLIILTNIFYMNKEYIKHTWVYPVVFLIGIVVFGIRLNKNVKKIKICDESLILNYSNETKEYNINTIDEIKIKAIWGSRIQNREFYLYVKSKGQNEYDMHDLYSFFNKTRIISIAIFVKLIKQNKLNEIDTITEEEIIDIENEILMIQ